MKQVLLASAVLLLLTASSAAARSGGAQKPYVLTAIANVGTVYWRYDCVHFRQPEWSLGVRWNDGFATTGYTYRAGRLVRRGDLPGGTIWFPFRKDGVQTLAFVQAIEPGTLRARVTVDWRGASHCESYFPPGVSMQLHPRG